MRKAHYERKEMSMNIRFDRAQLRLEARELIRLYDPRGARVECVRGALWITQDRDHEDYFLAANDALTLERPGLALIHAQERSEVVLSDAAPSPRLRQAIGRAFVAALRAVGRWLALKFGPESIDRHRRPGLYHGL